MSKELLKSMLKNVINDNHEQATTELHQYIVGKTRGVTGLGVTESADDDDDDDDENNGQFVTIETQTGDDAQAWDIEEKLKKAGIAHSEIEAYPGNSEASFDVYGNVSEDALEDALNDNGDDENDEDGYPRPTYSVRFHD